jgi:ribonuclease BN (tRNA processing enzyme)
MSGLRLLPLGVGDAFSALHYGSCLALEGDGAVLLVDCPHPVLKMMREASLASGLAIDPSRIDTVVVTHLHADHASGVETLAYYARFVLGRRLRVAAHPAVLARLWDAHLAAGMDALSPGPGEPPRAMRLEDYIEAVPLDEHHETALGPFTVACRRTIHHVPTTALRVRAAGRSVGLSSDTSFDPGLLAWLGGADLVAHETGYGIHTPLEALVALPEATRRSMRLYHYPDTLPGDAPIEPLVEGRVVDVEPQ